MGIRNLTRILKECDLESERNLSWGEGAYIYTLENGGKWWQVQSGAFVLLTCENYYNQSDWNASSGPTFIQNKPTVDYYNTGTTTTGVVIFYLTSDKTSGGTALYTSVNYINPVINDSTNNYTFGWVVSADKKTSSIAIIKVAQLIKIVDGHDQGINRLTDTIFKHKK